MNYRNEFRELGEEVSSAIDKAVVKVALVVHESVIRKTPVDTSFALSNWVLSINKGHTGTIPPYFPGTKGSSRKNSVEAAIAQGKMGVKAYKRGSTIVIRNNVPYIGDLDNGTSSQAGADFVYQAALAGVSSIDGLKL